MVAVLSSLCRFSEHSSALTIARCSAYWCIFCLTRILDFCVYLILIWLLLRLPLFRRAFVSKHLKCACLLIVFCMEGYRFCRVMPKSNFHASINQCFLFCATFGRTEMSPLFLWRWVSILSVCRGLRSTPYIMPL